MDGTAAAAQSEEWEALEAIYGQDIISLKTDRNSRFIYDIKLTSKCHFTLYLPESYPINDLPLIEFQNTCWSDAQKQIILNELAQCQHRAAGQVYLYEFIEYLREELEEVLLNDVIDDKPLVAAPIIEMKKPSIEYDIYHGNTLVDRKSTFQAHVCAVSAVKDVHSVVESLLQDRKIARATHNIMAYRIYAGGVSYHDNDDDGESGAGRKLSHLLELTGATNVVVVVSRWYGGIHLGPDRFKHINNTARELLQKHGFITNRKT